ncbi:hypothetical protein CVT26_010528 [Gymnopilus dilepis]|uniref:Uncharacterized protein n=1 Tax=Gymnopilus dilepis TaxID=231916 RepID=A0A409W523_9AGAR|nr:hypothetical protein CVT26_010528 [Gymnopilus dilepis]
MTSRISLARQTTHTNDALAPLLRALLSVRDGMLSAAHDLLRSQIRLVMGSQLYLSERPADFVFDPEGPPSEAEHSTKIFLGSLIQIADYPSSSTVYPLFFTSASSSEDRTIRIGHPPPTPTG